MSTQKSSTWMFTEALFIIAKTWKWTECPTSVKWINYSISRHYNIQHQKEMSYQVLENTWRNFECLVLNERRQSPNATFCIIPTTWHSKKTIHWRQCKKIPVMRHGLEARVKGFGGWIDRAQRILRDFENTLYDSIMMYIYQYISVKLIKCKIQEWTVE